jgi:LacI family transcriptional regulator
VAGIIPVSGDKKTILVFEMDYSAYHLTFIRRGIERLFDETDGGVVFTPLGVNDLQHLHGPEVLKRLAVIGMLRSQEARDFFIERNIPCLNLEETEGRELGFDVRFEGEGTIAAKCFLEEMNLGNLAFVGNEGGISHQRRLREFQRVASSRGLDVSTFNIPIPQVQKRFFDVSQTDIEDHYLGMKRFLEGLRKPVGVFCGNDNIALRIYYAAELMGIRVPEELAIIGIGSRDRVKEAWATAVSVVELDHQKLGQVGARLIYEYIDKNRRPKSVRLRPVGIRHSQTTFKWSVTDSMVRKALILIQENPSLGVVEICDHFGLSRSTVDARFHTATNVSLAKAIEIERFNLAKDLVKQKKYSFEAIASLAGYSNSRAMRRSFTRFTRMSPQQFRELSLKERGL